MLVGPIHTLSKTRFGINFKVNDIICKENNVNKKENKEVKKNIKEK